MLALDGAPDRVLALRGVSFESKGPEAIHQLPGQQIGFVAQDVEQAFPGWIDEDCDGFKRLTPRGFEALFVEALRELRTDQDERIAALERQVAQQEAERQRAHAASMSAEAKYAEQAGRMDALFERRTLLEMRAGSVAPAAGD